ncbi:hypothetical protein KUW17_18860 [Leisingera aquaemixtae]|uniref:hypothetical protein n=1 Tax=Leisingera aquaemixtae TaxID=1396826 RepID=UPI001C97C60D|nr:hypothetical protein [Leisingera aquaemixtae]MBY6068811.1 hypothetical protein [Leisingera aquaemixtae]
MSYSNAPIFGKAVFSLFDRYYNYVPLSSVFLKGLAMAALVRSQRAARAKTKLLLKTAKGLFR